MLFQFCDINPQCNGKLLRCAEKKTWSLFVREVQGHSCECLKFGGKNRGIS